MLFLNWEKIFPNLLMAIPQFCEVLIFSVLIIMAGALGIGNMRDRPIRTSGVKSQRTRRKKIRRRPKAIKKPAVTPRPFTVRECAEASPLPREAHLR